MPSCPRSKPCAVACKSRWSGDASRAWKSAANAPFAARPGRALIDGLTDATIVTVNRRGKYLVCPLDTGDELMMHLRMSGRLLVAAAGTERPPHTHVVMHLSR
jgi:formamidopyrimidine-DNA glycosylase